MTTALDTDVRTELEAIAERCGCELIHLDYAGGMLRLTLDSLEGVTIEHCERVSREASTMLDVCDFGNGRYTLEVSSPGLDRELYSARDYERFTGNRVKVTWRDPETSEQRTDIGLLSAYRAGDHPSIDLEVGDAPMNIRMASISTCRLEPEL